MNVVSTSKHHGLVDISHVRKGVVIIGANNPQTGRLMDMIGGDYVGFIDADPAIHEHCDLPVSGWDTLEFFIDAGATFVSVVSQPIGRLISTRRVIAAGGKMLSFIPPGAERPDKMGEAVYIQDHVVVQAGVTMGDNSVIHAGAVIGHGAKIGRSVFIGAANTAGNVQIDDGAFVGMGATILPDIHIGRFAIVGAGAVVTKDVAPYAKVAGVPARIIGANPAPYESGAIR